MKYNLITYVHVTPGNVHDSVPYLSRLDRQQERFGFKVEAITLDSGYLTTPIFRYCSPEIPFQTRTFSKMEVYF